MRNQSNLPLSRFVRLAGLFALFMSFHLTSCSDEVKPPSISNPASYIEDEGKLTMLHSLVDKEDGGGRIYEMNYTADYKLSEALQAQILSLSDLQQFAASHLFDRVPSKILPLSYGAGCSAYAATDIQNGHFLMGRNYDFYHASKAGGEDEIAALFVRTSPAQGKKSISMVDGYWLGYKKGFYKDGKTDLSALMLVPYAPMDGINEDGFAIGVLHLDGKPAIQHEAGKPSVYVTVAMRMLLDRASTVEQAVRMLEDYNMNMDSPAGGSYHFFVADATGDFAIIEYVSPQGNIDENPWKMHVLTGDDAMRYTTNFYNSPLMASTPYGSGSDHGKNRYNILKDALQTNGNKISYSNAMNLLEAASQKSDPTSKTSHTQWSSLYDLSTQTLRLAILREYGETQMMDFSVKGCSIN